MDVESPFNNVEHLQARLASLPRLFSEGGDWCVDIAPGVTEEMCRTILENRISELTEGIKDPRR